MSWIWAKLLSGIIFVLIPGFNLKDNFKQTPFLTGLSLLVGFFLLYISIKPLVEASDDMNNLKASLYEIKTSMERVNDERKQERIRRKEKQLHVYNQKLVNNTEKKQKKLASTRKKSELKKAVKKKKLIEKANMFKSRFIDNKNGTISDSESNLMWKKCSEGQKYISKGCSGTRSKYTWKNAVKKFNNVSFAGYNDWRIPTIKEYKTIYFYQNNIFPNGRDGAYWSSSQVPARKNYAWVYEPGSEKNDGGWHKRYALNIRLVR